MNLSGWGRYPEVDCGTATLRHLGDIEHILDRVSSLIPRGNGRAYGDAAMNPEATLFMGGCDRLRNFDVVSGIVDCEAGMLLSDLLSLSVPRGWFPPVVPGTKFVTIGGLIAADVHGKNHHHDGSFGRHVESLTLSLADGRRLTCSRLENRELFAATLGGMGLTGVILSACIRLRPIASQGIEETTVRARSFDELLRAICDHNSATYSVAWIDCIAAGADFGRGVLMLGEHAAAGAPLSSPKNRRLQVPFPLPVSPLNRSTVQIFNELYYRTRKPARRLKHYDSYFFPLDAIRNWNYVYGRRGFVQHQCVIGGSDAARGLRRILEFVQNIGLGTFLAVLKKFGPGQEGYLSFPMEGYTITLDFPVQPATFKALPHLDAIATEHGGRMYLAKDARMPREVFDRGYLGVEAFRALRRKIDPKRKFRSVQSERLGL